MHGRTTLLFAPIVIFSIALVASCGPQTILPDGEGDGDGVNFIPPDENGSSSVLAVNGEARVIADSLNMRSLAGTTNAVITTMSCGSLVKILAGPSEAPNAGWWNVEFSAAGGAKYTGWASGKYLIAAASFNSNACGSVSTADLSVGEVAPKDGGTTMPPTTNTEIVAIFDRAKLAVGYSYWWGHGAWRTDGANRGTCNGSCPSCTHTDSYGADCSGFVAKVWQVPSASALSVDAHPYSTLNFYSEETHWKQISRDTVKPADAMTRRANGAGHIVLVETADDPYGSLWLYEARACAAGIVHNARTIDSTYRTIRRDGL